MIKVTTIVEIDGEQVMSKDDVVETVVEDSNTNTTPAPEPADTRPIIIRDAKPKRDKSIVNLWKIHNKNKAGSLVLVHPPVGPERLQVPGGQQVAVINTPLSIDGGGNCYAVLSYGKDLASKNLDGKGYYIKDSELA